MTSLAFDSHKIVKAEFAALRDDLAALKADLYRALFTTVLATVALVKLLP